ncbi:hypothetical protein PIB30_060678 [Stylosanthes scabra]|uniref:Reverse transcriptase zinc-binding domain-containing protein n=1 Tax=Stylosanthes scabra TaxID=79078 RepID=A0ABU6QKI1_9FABA|nr:hypothetical protein [Stylosanthes scabra]
MLQRFIRYDWLARRKHVPTSSFRFKRGLTSSEIYLHCNGFPESISHCFFFCFKAHQIWQRFGFSRPCSRDHDAFLLGIMICAALLSLGVLRRLLLYVTRVLGTLVSSLLRNKQLSPIMSG